MELFSRRVGNRPILNPEKFKFGIRPNCNIGTLELGLHQFCTRSNSEYQKIWVGPITKSHFPKKFASSLDMGLQDLEAILALIQAGWNWAYQVLEGLE